jgi:hypothetical protein
LSVLRLILADQALFPELGSKDDDFAVIPGVRLAVDF